MKRFRHISQQDDDSDDADDDNYDNDGGGSGLSLMIVMMMMMMMMMMTMVMSIEDPHCSKGNLLVSILIIINSNSGLYATELFQ